MFFDRECTLLDIKHRLIQPRHPQTNGMVERFNGRISDVLATTRFRSREDLQATLERYEKLHNNHLPQRALGHKTPLQAIRTWQTERPELFTNRRDNQAGLDPQASFVLSVGLGPKSKDMPTMRAAFTWWRFDSTTARATLSENGVEPASGRVK